MPFIIDLCLPNMTPHLTLRHRLFLILRYASVKDKAVALAFPGS